MSIALSVIISIVAFIFVLGLIIAIHEWGHFFFARKAGILAREYAFGMGPILYKKRKGETLYSIRAFPIGGFCAIAGEEFEDDPFKDRTEIKLDIQNGIIKGFYLDLDNEKYPTYKIVSYDIFDEKNTNKLFMEVTKDGVTRTYPVDPKAFIYDKKLEYQIAPYNRTLGSKTKGQRAMVMFGGPLMNFLLAIVAFFVVALFTGFPNYASNKVNNVIENSPAEFAGLKDGDIITKLKAGDYLIEVDDWNDISKFFDEYEAKGLTSTITVDYKRNGSTFVGVLNPEVVIYNLAIISDYKSDKVKIGSISTDKSDMFDNSLLKAGDIILKVNNKDVKSWSDVMKVAKDFIGGSENKEANTLIFSVSRDGEVLDNLAVRPYSKKIMEGQKTSSGVQIPITKVQIGISPSYKFNLFKSVGYAFSRTVDSGMAVVETFNLLFTDNTVSIKALSGPVGIFAMTSNIASQGFLALLGWLGLLSVNVGLMNLLPIPALDGGRLVFLGYEAITKKKPNQKVETALITVTMILLLSLIVYVTFNDVLRNFFR